MPSFLPENHTSLASEVRSLVSPQQELGRLTRLILQPKLTINRPGDKYEQEADRVAEQVMRMPDKGVAGISKSRKEEKIQLKPLTATMTPLLQRQSEPEDKTEEDEEEIQAKPLATQITPLVQRQAASEEEMEEEEIQAKAAPGGSRTVTPLMAANINALRGGGQPLPSSQRAFFEPRFGADFSRVRVHSNTQAAETAKAMNARACTIGRDIVFDSSYGESAFCVLQDL